MRVSVLVGVLSLMLVGAVNADPASAVIRKPTNIPPEPLDLALKTLAKERQFQVLFRAEVVRDVKTGGAVGEFTPEEALKELLSGTGLSYKYLNANTVTVFSATAAQSMGSATTPPFTPSGSTKEAGKNSSQSFRVAQADQANAGSSAVNQNAPNSEPKNSDVIPLEEVLVTGSRLGNVPAQAAQPVSVYTREYLQSSGQTTVTDFLSTLPSVSVSQSVAGGRTVNGGGTVQLHGLPVGTTLVLINGRTIGTSSGQSAFGVNIFDLNTIPAAAIERIEVIPTGSSAIYGSDAIAGVVNIVLRTDLNGVEISGKYGGASSTDYGDADFAWGKEWDRGSFSVIADYEHQTELLGSERSLTSTNDFTPYGGPDNRVTAIGSPGNVFSVNGLPLPGLGATTYAAVPHGFQGTPTIAEFANTAGTLNSASTSPFSTLLPDFSRVSLFANGGYELTDSVSLFTEILYSASQQTTSQLPPYLLGLPTYQQYTVSASNPYNPFGETVGIGKLLTEYGTTTAATPDDFVRALVGARGHFAQGWDWELASWDVDDHARYSLDNSLNPVAVQTALNSSNPATALNPFIDGPAGSPALLQSLLGSNNFGRALSRRVSTNGFVRGSLLDLPAGPLSVVVGSEYDSDKLDSDEVNYYGAVDERNTYRRHSYAAFGEARMPLLGSPTTSESLLALTAAARYDHDSVFGGQTTPQFGLEFRPQSDWLVRATYGRAFKAPSLLSLYGPETSSFYYATDPRNGNAPVAISDLSGGNASLKPETGHSITAGLVYKPRAVPGLNLSATHWEITEDNSIQSIDPQTIINNENLFPGRVIRNSQGVITEVDSTYVNFGTISVRGIDYQIDWTHQLGSGALEASAAATQTYRYVTALLPGLPLQDRVSQASADFDWAPRWKAATRVSWSEGPFSSTIVGRYTGKYRDYQALPDGFYQTLGNFWILDATVKVRLKAPRSFGSFAPQGEDLELGAVNLFDRLPQYSNTPYGVGFDATQADIRGRFIYVRLSADW